MGVLTDGETWILYHSQPSGELAEVSRTRLSDDPNGESLTIWLETVLATNDNIAPTPDEIVKRLGAGSPAAQLDLADLHALYAACRTNPEVQIKRELWARLLLSALGTSFEDSDELFVTHTYLVLTAELIAHEVMGLPTNVVTGDIRELLEGQQFAVAGLHGVVEADFFDWPAVASQGQPIIAGIARRLSQFDWSNVQHDVLKTLYESIIDTETRHRLGEYYTPDWLAEKIVNERFDKPLKQRLLDPACGSGTFLFWAVRRLLAACDKEGLKNRVALERVVSQVQGVDLHPVAVTLARVTYLLALTPDRLADRNRLTIPVFLGDSVRWEQDDTVVSENGMTIRTSDPLNLLEDDLHFPEGVVEDPVRFDRLVADLAARAADREPGSTPPGIAGILNRHKVTGDDDREAVIITFKKLCRLYDDGRDHVWSYYIRNLARPLSFTRPEGHVDILVGNPPWLSYRVMPKKMQTAYRTLSEERGLWAGGTVATNQDLSDLFVARAVEQYLKPMGSFTFVMPFAVLSRRQYSGFRTGNWSGKEVVVKAELSGAESFASVEPPIFGMPPCVISGTKGASSSRLPEMALMWAGTIPNEHLDWASVLEHLVSTQDSVLTASDTDESPYKARFRQGATVVPRFLVTVDEVSNSRIGVTAGSVRVRSARSANEKPPWKSLPQLKGVVEKRFVRSMHLGATVLPFRASDPQLAMIPAVGGQLIDGSMDRLDEFPGLAKWWREAEKLWEKHKTKRTQLTLLERLNFHNELQKQFPVPRQRIVYTKSGNRLAACRIDSRDAIIDHTLYWAAVNSVAEGRYLAAILNSNAVQDKVEPLMSQGQFGKRHVDKYVFAAAFPIFDPENDAHTQLVQLAKHAEQVAATLDLENCQFQKARRAVREALQADGVMTEIDAAVADLLTTAAAPASGTKSASATSDLMGALSKAQEKTKRGKAGKRRRKRAAAKPTKKSVAQKSSSRATRGG